MIKKLVGREKVLELYKLAVEKEMRFFSYGDAMYIDLENYDKEAP